MTNKEAYKFEGFEEWLRIYKSLLKDDLKSDVFVTSDTCKKFLKDFPINDLRNEGMDDNEILDYARLCRGWLVGAYDGALFGYNDMLSGSGFRLLNNETHSDNLKALRFLVFLDLQYKDKHRSEIKR